MTKKQTIIDRFNAGELAIEVAEKMAKNGFEFVFKQGKLFDIVLGDCDD